MRYFISLIGLAIIVGAGYFAVAQYANVAHGQGLLVPDQSSANVSVDGARVIALLNRLTNINLDGTIFSNPSFLTLQDWSVTIAAQTVGRSNPYLPASGSASAQNPGSKVVLPKSNK